MSVEALEKKLDSMARYIGRLESRVDSLSEDNDRLRTSLAELSAKDFKLEGKLEKLADYCSRLEEDMGAYDGIPDVLSDLSGRLEVLEGEGEQLG